VRSLILLWLAVGAQGLLAQLTRSGPPLLELRDFGDVTSFEMSDARGRNVTFRYLGVSEHSSASPSLDFPGNPIVVSGSTWTTPARVDISLHPENRFGAGSKAFYLHFSTVGETPETTGSVGVWLRFPPYDAATGVEAVVSSYSRISEAAPGSLLSIVLETGVAGANLRPVIDNVAQYPKSLAGVSITINGRPAPIFSIQGRDVQTAIPYELDGQPYAEIVVTMPRRRPSEPIRIPLRATAPALLTLARNGRGQIDAQQVGGTGEYRWVGNSAEEPARRGQVLELFATGAGAWGVKMNGDVALGDAPNGRFGRGAWTFTAKPVSVTIGGQPAAIYYVGTAPGRPWGVLQVNAYVPDGVGSGPQPIVLKIGENDNSAQRTTVVIE